MVHKIIPHELNDKPSAELAEAMAKKVYADAQSYHRIWPGLVSVLSAQGYAIVYMNGRWHATRKMGSRISPKGGYHSFEDMLTALIEVIKADD